MDAGQLWGDYRRAFGEVPDGQTQEFLRDMGATASAMRGETTLEGLHAWALKLEGYRAPSAASKARQQTRRIDPDASLEALARIVALAAEDYLGPAGHLTRITPDPVVQSFRDDPLGGQVLSLDESARWVEQQADAERDLPMTEWIEFPLTPLVHKATVGYLGDPEVKAGVIADISRLIDERPTGHSRRYKHLEYRRADGSPGAVPARFGSTLDRLRELSEDLSKTYSWTQESAVTFVLTGEPPSIPKATATLRHSRWPASATLTMTLRPCMTANEVKDWYVTLRDALWKMHEVDRHRPRAVEDARSNELAVFVAHANDGRSWVEAMCAWNVEQPEFAYKDEVRFRRDCNRAWERVTGARLDWTSGRTRVSHVDDEDRPEEGG